MTVSGNWVTKGEHFESKLQVLLVCSIWISDLYAVFSVVTSCAANQPS